MSTGIFAKYIGKDFEEKEVELRKNREGLFFRPGTSDAKMLSQSKNDYPTVDPTGKVVMDCGANVGGFCARAVRAGAQRIVAYEPDHLNLEILKLNVQGFDNVELIEKALIDNDDDEITFYIRDSQNSACSGSTTKLIGSNKKVVKAINFWKELDRVRPSLIKMDIESGEYAILLDRKLPDYVKEITIEIHAMNKTTIPLKDELFRQLKEQFPVVHHEEIVYVFYKPRLLLAHLSRE